MSNDEAAIRGQVDCKGDSGDDEVVELARWIREHRPDVYRQLIALLRALNAPKF